MNKLNHDSIRKNIKNLKRYRKIITLLALTSFTGLVVMLLSAIFESIIVAGIGFLMFIIYFIISDNLTPPMFFDDYHNYNYLRNENINYIGYEPKNEDIVKVIYEFYDDTEAIEYHLYNVIDAHNDDELNYERIYDTMTDEMVMHFISIRELTKVMKVLKSEKEAEMFKNKVEDLWN